MTKRQNKIVAAWEFWDDDDCSTERLIALVCDACNCEVEEVIEALKAADMLEDCEDDQ